MNFQDIFKKSFLEGFSGTDITTSKIMTTMIVTCVLALYIFGIYKLVTRKTFYLKTFHIATAVIAIITAGIVLAMQSSLVISLGMVGALSIIRFRTAIKDPMDLIFMFWSISIGIICGAGLYEIAVIISMVVTILILLLELIPIAKSPMILVVNCDKIQCENAVIDILDKYESRYKIKSRNVSNHCVDLVIELKTESEREIMAEVSDLDNVTYISLLAHDGEVTF